MQPGSADNDGTRRQKRGHQMTGPWGLFEAGMWLMFLVWGVAWHLCRDDQADGMDAG
jgi:hypothetical protein